MTQLTIRGFDKPLERRLRELARSRRISLNRAALELLRRGAGLSADAPTTTVGSSLDRLVGTWTQGDQREFDQAVAEMSRVDSGFWQ